MVKWLLLVWPGNVSYLISKLEISHRITQQEVLDRKVDILSVVDAAVAVEDEVAVVDEAEAATMDPEEDTVQDVVAGTE